jgi:hypothetical protein
MENGEMTNYRSLNLAGNDMKLLPMNSLLLLQDSLRNSAHISAPILILKRQYHEIFYL